MKYFHLSSFSMALALVLLVNFFTGMTGMTATTPPPAVSHWKAKLPSTPVPTLLQNLLPDESGAYVVALRAGPLECVGGKVKYDVASQVSKLRADPEMAFALRFSDLQPGHTTNKLDFERTGRRIPTLLPRDLAERIRPLSALGALQQALGAPQEAMSAFQDSRRFCEKREKNGEEATVCATSLEEVADFVSAQLGTGGIVAYDYSIHNNKVPPHVLKEQAFKLEGAPIKLPSKQSVSCHLMHYPVAVFYCHRVSETQAYLLSLLGEEDGSRVTAAATCHLNTSSWNPKQATLLMLGVSPGTPVCHMFPRGNILFLASS